MKASLCATKASPCQSQPLPSAAARRPIAGAAPWRSQLPGLRVVAEVANSLPLHSFLFCHSSLIEDVVPSLLKQYESIIHHTEHSAHLHVKHSIANQQRSPSNSPARASRHLPSADQRRAHVHISTPLSPAQHRVGQRASPHLPVTHQSSTSLKSTDLHSARHP